MTNDCRNCANYDEPYCSIWEQWKDECWEVRKKISNPVGECDDYEEVEEIEIKDAKIRTEKEKH